MTTVPITNSIEVSKIKILVTGGAGFIGSHLCQALLSAPDLKQLIILDNLNDYYDPAQKRANLSLLQSHPQAQKKLIFLEEDIRTTQAITQHQPQLVVHLAAMAGVRTSLQQPEYYADVNILGQIHLLEQIRQIPLPDRPKFIYASSSSVYGLNTKVPFSEEDPLELPNSSYACSKLVTEIYAHYYHRMYQIDNIGLRFFTVYGPRGRPDMAPFKFLQAVHQGQEITKYGAGESYRDYTYIDDIIQGILGAQQYLLNTQASVDLVFNLGNQSPISLNEFIRTIEEVVGRPAIIKQLPDQPGDVPRTFADTQRAEQLLGYRPNTDLKTGLTLTYAWLKTNNRS